MHFKKATNYSFYDQWTLIPEDTFKLNFRVDNWPFKAITNTLIVYIDSQSSIMNINKCTQASNDVTGNLVWIKISYDGASLYPITTILFLLFKQE